MFIRKHMSAAVLAAGSLALGLSDVVQRAPRRLRPLLPTPRNMVGPPFMHCRNRRRLIGFFRWWPRRMTM
jgi:hypothetical protein